MSAIGDWLTKRTFSAATVIAVTILLALLGVSIHAYATGEIEYGAFVITWKEPFLLLLGFIVREIKEVSS